MKHWTRKRKASLLVHAGFVTIPFTISTVSAYLFWYARFQTEWLAAPMVVVIDLLALTGLVLFIVGIESPFAWLRHLLPFVSVIPLGWELYGLLIKHNDPLLSGAVTAFVTTVLAVIAWQCFRTIERLFIDPVEAARERARERVRELDLRLAELRVEEEAARGFVVGWLEARRGPHVEAQEPPQLPAGETGAEEEIHPLPKGFWPLPPGFFEGEGTEPRPLPQDTDLRILKGMAAEMRAEDPPRSWAAIGQIVGRSPTTVRGWLEGKQS